MSLKGSETTRDMVDEWAVTNKLLENGIEPYEEEVIRYPDGRIERIQHPTLAAFRNVCVQLRGEQRNNSTLFTQLKNAKIVSSTLLLLIGILTVLLTVLFVRSETINSDNLMKVFNPILLGIGIVIGAVYSGRRFRCWEESLTKNSRGLSEENSRLCRLLRENDAKLKAEEARNIREYQEAQRRRERRADMLAQYEGKPVRFLFHIPANMSVANGGFPVVKGWKREDYWVYITPEGRCFHRKECGSVHYSAQSVRVWDIPSTYIYCLRCQPKHDDFSWYKDMRNLERNLRRLGFRMDVQDEVVHLIDMESGGQEVQHNQQDNCEFGSIEPAEEKESS